MIVDDESALRQLLIRALTQVGFCCDMAEDGQVALELIGQREYDLLVTDLRMPRINGHALSAKILQNDSGNVPVICVLTGIAEPRIEQDLRKRGVQHIYKKPIEYKQFASEMLQLMDERAANADPEMQKNQGQARHSLAVLTPDLTYSSELLNESTQFDFELVVAVSTDHLLEIVHDRRIDLLLIDQQLPGFLKGDQIVKHLHADLINIPAFLRVGDDQSTMLDISKCDGVERLVTTEQTSAQVLENARNFLSRLSYRRLMIEPAARRLVADSSDVPPIPHVLTRLANHLSKPIDEISIAQIAEDIESDSRLTSELIKVSNSAEVASTNKQKDLKGIVALLGPQRTIAMCLSLGLRTVRSQLMKSWAEDLRTWYLRRTSIIAATAEAYAKHFEAVPPETAFLLGVIQDIGIMVLAQHYGQSYFERVIQRVRTVPTLNYVTSERMVTNTDHGMVSAAVLQSWGFPFSIVQPVYAHHNDAELPNLSKMGAGLVRCLRIGEAFAEMCDQPAPQRIHRVNQLLEEYYKKGRLETRHIFLEAIEKANRTTEILHTPPIDTEELQSIVNQLEERQRVEV